jgi:nucleotide-binding universal stress UspA family protein
MQPPSIVCPVDFSDTSRTALQYAGAIADHFGARLTVLSVDDPLLATVAANSGRVPSLAEATEGELRRFIESSLTHGSGAPKALELRVAVGKPAVEILRLARDSRADLIVMSSEGRSGAGKRFFGSTTEGVLRATDVPVLVTPRGGAAVGSLSAIVGSLHHIVVPVDLSPASAHQVTIAAGIGKSLSVPLIVPHVIEPVFVPAPVRWAVPGLDAERRADAETQLREFVERTVTDASVETLVLSGDPSEEIVRLAEARDAGLIVMGLHSSSLLGPRMGTVTYRVLSLSRALVLAIPPVRSPSDATGDAAPV